MPPPASCAWSGTDANEQLLKGYAYCEDTPVGSAARGAACLECCDPGANKENNDWQADCAFAAGVPFGRVYDASYASANCAPSSWCKSKECSTKGGSIAMLRMCDATLKDQLRDSPEGALSAYIEPTLSDACLSHALTSNQVARPPPRHAPPRAMLLTSWGCHLMPPPRSTTRASAASWQVQKRQGRGGMRLPWQCDPATTKGALSVGSVHIHTVLTSLTFSSDARRRREYV